MRRLLWTLLAVSGLAFAQDSAREAQERLQKESTDRIMQDQASELAKRGLAKAGQTVQKLIEVKYADPDRVARLVQGPGISLRSDSSLHAIVVNGPADAVTEVEAMVRKL